MKKRRVLIIKAGYSEFLEQEKDSRIVSYGDILRTTPILHLFKEDHVTWVTDESAFPLLEGNEYISRLLRFDWITPWQLINERFDVLINLEKVPGICAMAEKISAVKRYGFRFDPEERKAEAFDESSEALSISSSFEAKKENRKTVQELLFDMLGKKWNGEGYILGYQPDTKEEYDIGLNMLVGTKFPNKAWSLEKWNELVNLLENTGLKVTRQDQQNKDILTNLYRYMDWINSSKIIVSSDSLGMHLGIALKKKVVGLFGPTSEKEVYFYDKGRAILPAKDFKCMPCFLSKCTEQESCLRHIEPAYVYQEIKNLI